MRIKYNSPVILTYAILCMGVLVINNGFHMPVIRAYFTAYPGLDFSKPVQIFRLVSHIVGHAGWNHLLGNFTIILLVGPLLEEKYGSFKLFEMIFVTALITGLVNAFFFSTGLMGASGIAFMLVLLASISNIKAGEIPLTFIIVAVLFLGNEIIGSLRPDGISQSAHLIGGFMGAAYGLLRI